MSDTDPIKSEPLSDAPGQVKTHADILAEREARTAREAQEDAERKAADDAADAKQAEAEHAKAEPLSSAATIAPPFEPMPAEKPPAEVAAEDEAAAQAKEAADREAKAEEDKAHRAEHGMTASPNGDVAGVAYSARIEAAKFEHRNQGHDDTMQLIDDLFAGIQRLEAKLAG